ncbi:MAG TPA: hypothetical protein VGX27_03435 [Candidatus Dormibacteraeota bacterium]|nr:hypothetical protein [Candidatus Dormibacteraeota bacterium]
MGNRPANSARCATRVNHGPGANSLHASSTATSSSAPHTKMAAWKGMASKGVASQASGGGLMNGCQ